MKKITIIVRSLCFTALLFGLSNAEAQVEIKIQTEMGTRFNDVNDLGHGVTQTHYYDFESDMLTPMESDAVMLASINNSENTAGMIYYDEPNFILQGGYKIDGEWQGIGFLPGQDINDAYFDVYSISSNSQYITGQTSVGVDYGCFIFDTATQELTQAFDSQGEASAAYAVNDNGILAGWVDRPDSFGTLRVPAYRTLDGEFHLIPEGQLPTLSGINTVGDINNSNVMVGDFDLQPFMYDMNTNTFTLFDVPEGADSAAFSSISENGVAVGYADVDWQVRDAIIYHPSLGDQPLYLKDVLADNGVDLNTFDGYLGTSIAISPNGKYIAGWLNGPPMYAEGWMVNLDELILGTQYVAENSVSFYPNPIQDVMHINAKSAIDSVEVYTITGQRVSSLTTNNNHTEIDFSHLSAGVYLVKVSSNNSIENLKVIKQ
jgi:hypothetical protein